MAVEAAVEPETPVPLPNTLHLAGITDCTPIATVVDVLLMIVVDVPGMRSSSGAGRRVGPEPRQQHRSIG
jgi:hypothetical protein